MSLKFHGKGLRRMRKKKSENQGFLDPKSVGLHTYCKSYIDKKAGHSFLNV